MVALPNPRDGAGWRLLGAPSVPEMMLKSFGLTLQERPTEIFAWSEARRSTNMMAGAERCYQCFWMDLTTAMGSLHLRRE
jgi:hypothetical protein